MARLVGSRPSQRTAIRCLFWPSGNVEPPATPDTGKPAALPNRRYHSVIGTSRANVRLVPARRRALRTLYRAMGVSRKIGSAVGSKAIVAAAIRSVAAADRMRRFLVIRAAKRANDQTSATLGQET